jgi:hypothetical protein
MDSTPSPDKGQAPSTGEGAAPLPARGRTSIARIVALVGIVAIFVMFFLPLGTTTGDDRALLLEYADEESIPELGMTNADVADMSLVELGVVYGYAAFNETGDTQVIGIICLVLSGLILLFAILGLVAALRRRPVGLIVLTLLDAGAFAAYCWDLGDRGVIGGTRLFGPDYSWGVARVGFYVACAVVVVGAVWMLVERHRARSLEGRGAEPAGRGGQEG